MTKTENKKIVVCGGAGCVSKGANKVYEKLISLLKEQNINFAVSLEKDCGDDKVRLTKSGCHGFCEMGPLVRIEPQGWLYTKVKIDDCLEIIEETIEKGECVDRLAYKKNGEIYREQSKIPFYKQQTRVVLEHCGKIDSVTA